MDGRATAGLSMNLSLLHNSGKLSPSSFSFVNSYETPNENYVQFLPAEQGDTTD